METIQALPLSAFCCQNERCEDCGKKGLGNIYQHWWANRAKTIRNLRCRTCQKDFSERKGTVWYQSKLSREKALTLARHLAEGDGIRKTGRLAGATQETVIRWNRKLGEHGKALHEEKVQHVKVREAQADEMWSFVGKKRKAVRPKQSR